VGKENNHLKLKLEKNGIAFNAIGFGLAKNYPLTPNSYIDVVYSLEDNSWNGTRILELKLRDLRVY